MSVLSEIEESIRNNPLQLGSVNRMEDVVDLARLDSVKRHYQRCYAQNPQEWCEADVTSVPFLKLDRCSLYPNIHGGANTQVNSIIAPSLIAKEADRVIPREDIWSCGEKAKGERIPIYDLYNSLQDRFGEKEVDKQLIEASRSGYFHTKVTQYPKFSGMQNEQPVLELLIDVFASKGFLETCGALSNVKRVCKPYPIYGDLLALIIFKDYSWGEENGLLLRVANLSYRCFCANRRNNVRCYEKAMYQLIRRYMKHFFNVNIESMQAVVAFYNSLFTQKVLGIGNSGELLCYSYFGGSVREEPTGFFVPDDAITASFMVEW